MTTFELVSAQASPLAFPIQRCVFQAHLFPQKFARNQGHVSQFGVPNGVKSFMRRSPHCSNSPTKSGCQRSIAVRIYSKQLDTTIPQYHVQWG